jgi:CubicO group peptidase (beta-lactamase class C family)
MSRASRWCDRCNGTADLEHDVPITLDTVFEVGSVSKQFTAAAVLLLARDGKLSLDDVVRKYSP